MAELCALFDFQGEEYEVTGTVFAFRDGDSELGYSEQLYEVNVISIYREDGEEFFDVGELGDAAQEALINEYNS